MSPASTSTHSPDSSPSMPMIVGAGLLELVAHVMRERLDLSVRVGAGDDQRVVEAGELADVEDGDVACLDVLEGGDGGFLQLVKSHPVRWAIELVVVNIGQNGGGQQTADLRDARRGPARAARGSPWRRSAAASPTRAKMAPAGAVSSCDRGPRGSGSARARPAARAAHPRRGVPGRVTTAMCASVGDLAPSMPLRQPRERVDADDEHSGRSRLFVAQLASVSTV